MAVAPRLQGLAGRWQIPLLAASVSLFVAGLLQLRPEIPKVTFEDHLRDVRVALQAESYDVASDALTTVLNGQADLTDAQRSIAHRMLAETIWLAESTKTQHDSENARRILSNFAVAQRLGDPVQEADHLRIAKAADWIGDQAQSLEAYQKALQVVDADRVSILQRIVEILLSQSKRDWEQIDSCVDRLFAEAAAQPQALTQALQWKMQRLLARDDIQAAKALIRSVEPKLDVPPWSYHLQYFQALVLFREGQFEAAEGRLRALQANLRRSNPLYAQAGWLLGRINYMENRPDIALSFYDEIVHTHAGTEYWLASLLGKAESLAGLERYAAAAETYEQVITAIQRSQGSLLLDEQAIRESLRTLGVVLSQRGRPVEALPFVQTAERLVPADQTDVMAALVELEARIQVQAGDECSQRAGPAVTAAPAFSETAAPLEAILAAATAPAAAQRDAATQPAATQPAEDDPLVKARQYYAEAGELYARLSKLRVLNGSLAMDADWESARYFDRAKRWSKAIEAYQAFALQHANNSRAPEAMNRLGRILQITGQIDEAIAVYEKLLDKHGRTPSALASLVPLARCHMAHGQKGYARAEQVLLSIVEADPDRAAIFDPAAAEFRDALMELADLYMRWSKPERAIERLEQALSLYPEDPDITRLEYQLASAYRSSGLTLRSQALKSKQPTQSDAMLGEAYRRLGRARELFDRVASRLDVSQHPLSPTDQTYLKTSYVYRADCAFDTGRYSEAAESYGRVAWRWQNDPVSLAAYVQIVRSDMAVGDMAAARSALARARWILRRIPDSRFNQPPDLRSRNYWTQLFDWVEKTGLLNG